ncbi:MAG: S8 family serine peptidase [Clostridia bacterium]|nr:S8 family serine peptidase [Clostridia bacterium]
MLARGVNVINGSFVLGSMGYTNVSAYIDEQIHNNMLTMCLSVGNREKDTLTNGIKSSSAHAYNAIVVGNVNTELSKSSPYEVHVDSLVTENIYRTNKPDIVASGTNIIFPPHSADETTGGLTGTSCSAAFVTGTVALMMQKNNSLISNPMAVKAILSASANPDLISNAYPMDRGTLLGDRSGAGLLDASEALYAVQNQRFFTISQSVSELDYQFDTAVSLYLNAGDTIRVAATFMKSNDDVILSNNVYGTDIDIALMQVSSSIHWASSTSAVDNVEIFEYTVTESGYYFIQYVVLEIDSTPFSLNLGISWDID